jgi:hypothetical protein
MQSARLPCVGEEEEALMSGHGGLLVILFRPTAAETSRYNAEIQANEPGIEPAGRF